MTFLPEDDLDFLKLKEIPYQLKIEGDRRGIIFPEFEFTGNLAALNGTELARRNTCQLLVLIPSGYAATKLDSFYTQPFLKRADGANPNCATELQPHFGESWQFWSRHLNDGEWRAADGLHTFMQYIRAELAKA